MRHLLRTGTKDSLVPVKAAASQLYPNGMRFRFTVLPSVAETIRSTG
jgi:hypothetical protein